MDPFHILKFMDHLDMVEATRYAPLPYIEMMPDREIIPAEQYDMLKYHSNRDKGLPNQTRKFDPASIMYDLQRHYESEAPYRLLTNGKNSFGSHMKFMAQVIIIQPLTKKQESDLNYMNDLKALKKLYNIQVEATDLQTITMDRIVASFTYFPAITYHFTHCSGAVLLPPKLNNFPCAMKVINFMTLIPKRGIKVAYRAPINAPSLNAIIKDWDIVYNYKRKSDWDNTLNFKIDLNEKNDKIALNQNPPKKYDDSYTIKDVSLNEKDKILLGKAVYAYVLTVDKQDEHLFGEKEEEITLLRQCLVFYNLWLPDDIRCENLRLMDIIEFNGSTLRLTEMVRKEVLLMIAFESSCALFHY